jgi:L-iditol 2-dehydrogenase
VIGLAKVAAGEGHVELVERPERAPGAGEVALDVHAVGICGTDLHIWLGEYPSVPPVTMGHEVCGVVAAVGDGVDRGWLGARVAVETFF